MSSYTKPLTDSKRERFASITNGSEEKHKRSALKSGERKSSSNLKNSKMKNPSS